MTILRAIIFYNFKTRKFTHLLIRKINLKNPNFIHIFLSNPTIIKLTTNLNYTNDSGVGGYG